MDPAHVRSLAASQPLIEQAKGILMGCYGCDADVAFAVLAHLSSTRNLKVRELAAVLVKAASGDVGADAPPGPADPAEPVERVRLLVGDDHRGLLGPREASGRGEG